MPDPAFFGALGARYEIERELGHGGMGRVFVARDLKLDREVAIKFLQTGKHDEEDLRRFEQEARAAGSLEHPNVLTVHDIGASDEGPFIVAEFLQGSTLRERMGGKALPLGKAVDYALQLAQGLRAAHSKGVVHRDLKPENVFITHEGRLKILDFGIAKLRPRSDAPRTITDEGAICGTVAYMSPEQVRGQRADARSDIFAFGSILYEMITARPAFACRSEIETGAAILIDDPPDLPDHVPRALQRIVWRCLEKAPKDRFQSATDVAIELSGERGRGPRRLWLAMLAGAVLFAAAVFPAVKERLMRARPVEQGSIAVLPFENLSSDQDNEYLSDGVTEELINALANVEGLRVASRTSSFVFKGKKISAAEIGRQLRVATLLEGSVRRHGNSLRVVAKLIDVANGFHIWSRTYDRELKNVLSVEDELARSIAQALRPSLALAATPLVRHRTTSVEAHDLYLRARYFWNDRTEAGLRKAIALYQQAIRADPDYALAHAGIADCYLLLRNYAQADDPKELLSKARLHGEKALQADGTLAEAHTSLASIAEAEFDWKTAEQEYRRAINLKPDYARGHHWYGLLLRDLGRFDDAEAELARALQLEPTSMPILIISSSMPYFRRDYDKAIEQLTRLLDVAADPFVPLLLAVTYLEKGRAPDALAVVDRTTGPSDDDSGWLALRGYVHARAGDRNEALRVLAELERRAQRQYVAPANLALVHAGLGNANQAFAILDEGCAVRDATLASVKVDPLWDGLRQDPRFPKLLQRMNFE